VRARYGTRRHRRDRCGFSAVQPHRAMGDALPSDGGRGEQQQLRHCLRIRLLWHGYDGCRSVLYSFRLHAGFRLPGFLVVRDRKSGPQRNERRRNARTHADRMSTEKLLRSLRGRSRLRGAVRPTGDAATLRRRQSRRRFLLSAVRDGCQLRSRRGMHRSMDGMHRPVGDKVRERRRLPACERYLSALRRGPLHAGVRERWRLRRRTAMQAAVGMLAACRRLPWRRELLLAMPIGRRLPDGLLLQRCALFHRALLHHLRRRSIVQWHRAQPTGLPTTRSIRQLEDHHVRGYAARPGRMLRRRHARDERRRSRVHVGLLDGKSVSRCCHLRHVTASGPVKLESNTRLATPIAGRPRPIAARPRPNRDSPELPTTALRTKPIHLHAIPKSHDPSGAVPNQFLGRSTRGRRRTVLRPRIHGPPFPRRPRSGQRNAPRRTWLRR
jgi:hypothetical protein